MIQTVSFIHDFFYTKLTFMKTSFLIFVLVISFTSFGQQTDFTVAAGIQRTLTAAERTLSLKNFILGDDCVIIIPSTMDGWTVTATDVTIGKNVRIIGVGLIGASGNAGLPGSFTTYCAPGGNGGNGHGGLPGTAGKTVSLTLRIRQIESLTIIVSGGNGGNGGSGGSGGRGGIATCNCNAGAGGNGGNGGASGSGGKGGKVNIVYSGIGSASVSNSNFIIQNAGGRSGMGGISGSGGAGGTGGGCSDPKALARPAGIAGKPGIPGAVAFPGANGVTTLQKQ